MLAYSGTYLHNELTLYAVSRCTLRKHLYMGTTPLRGGQLTIRNGGPTYLYGVYLQAKLCYLLSKVTLGVQRSLAAVLDAIR